MIQHARSVSARGALGLSSPNVRRNAMDAVVSQEVRHSCVRSSRVVPIPRRWDQPLGQEPGGTVANKPGTPRRARSSRKTIAQGMPDVSALPDDLCALYPFQHTRLRVRPAPGIPCALFNRGRDALQAPDAKIAPRECGVMSSIVVPAKRSASRDPYPQNHVVRRNRTTSLRETNAGGYGSSRSRGRQRN